MAAVGDEGANELHVAAGLVGKAEARVTPSGPELTDPLLEHWLAERGLF